MATGQTEGDFALLMANHKKVWEAYLIEFETFATLEEVTDIASGKGNVELFWQHLNQVYKFDGNSEKLQLSEPQFIKLRLQTSQLMAQHQTLLESLSKLCVELFRIHEVDRFDPGDESLRLNFKKQYKMVALVTVLFLNFSSRSEDFCLALSRIGFLFTDYAKPLLDKWFDEHSTKKKCWILTQRALGFTYNMFQKSNSTIHDRLTRLEVVQPVMRYLKSPEYQVRVTITLLIAFALDFDNARDFSSADDVIKFIVAGLKVSLISKKRMYKHLPSGVRFHILELAVCINRLALNEANQKNLVQFGLMQVLLTMLSRDKEDEVAEALKILLTLSSSTDYQQLIQQNFSGVLRWLPTTRVLNGDMRRTWDALNRVLEGLEDN